MTSGKSFFLWGILNATPDSFSDGDPLAGVDEFVARGLRLAGEGADFIDLGGESSRPGFSPISADEEMDRVLPTLEALLARTAVPISVDTRRATVAAAALAMGAVYVNDVFGLQGDGAMAQTVAHFGAGVVAMHRREEILRRGDILEDVAAFWEKSLAIAAAAGIDPKKVLLDPGIGFAKTVEQNVAILRNLHRLCSAFPDREIFLGVSRKSVLGALCGEPDPRRRDLASVVVAQEARRCGVRHFRVHAVAMARQALELGDAIRGR
ncbi:MAG: dihydropteroate synthase [Puniceicoccales bacterium]|jgi:dihydropteroate synthase|nr:dihydropteroate synthase [Puniceicoccales bacterium]